MQPDSVLVATDTWNSTFPAAVAGALVMSRIRNPAESAELESRKRQLEADLRAQAVRLGRDGIGSELQVRSYLDYYRARGKTYQVKAQWESVALKGKPIPRRAALVEAMYMAELKNLILTAGHDFATLALPVRVDVTHEDDRYVLMNGSERVLKAGDMMMEDGKGIISSVLHGPDRRTRITRQTREVLFAVYAPGGVGESAVRSHLEDIRATVLLMAPEAETALIATLQAP
jgi:DNA/RNA-binding domain of Phe-tRNA-synthetase-like protein